MGKVDQKCHKVTFHLLKQSILKKKKKTEYMIVELPARRLPHGAVAPITYHCRRGLIFLDMSSIWLSFFQTLVRKLTE